MCRNRTRLEAVRIAHPDNLPATAMQDVGNRQSRENMPPGTAGHDEERPAHNFAPRINCLAFWLRPRCALNLLRKLAFAEIVN
jgi:hypothetical protein